MYETQVRKCLQKQAQLEDEWNYCLENIDYSFISFSEQHAKLKDSLPTGKNLAELSSMSRREKEALQNFELSCIEAKDRMLDLGKTQLDYLIERNAQKLSEC